MRETGSADLPPRAGGARRHAGRGRVHRRLTAAGHGRGARDRYASHLAGRRHGRYVVLPGRSHRALARRGGGTAAVTDRETLTGGVIAAGEGRRLRRDGWTMAKPLVPVAGVPLIEHVLTNFRAAGITRLTII